MLELLLASAGIVGLMLWRLSARVVIVRPAQFSLIPSSKPLPLSLRQRARYLRKWLQTRRVHQLDPGQLALQVAARYTAGYDARQAWLPLERSAAAVHQSGQKGWQRRLGRRAFTRRLVPRWPPARRGKTGTQAQDKLRQLRGVQCFTKRVGAEPAVMLRQLATGLSESARAADERVIALAGPKATAILLAALPPLLVAGAIAAGMPLLPTYLGGGIGSFAAGAGIALYLVGILWIKRATEQAAQLPEEVIDPGLCAELIHAGLASGADLPTLLDAIADAFRVPQFQQLAASLLAGTTWEVAWREAWAQQQCSAAIAQIGQILAQSWQYGIAPAGLLAQAAASYRADRVRIERAAAARLGVRLALPLGLCLLPAFVLLLIVPLVVNGVSSAW